MDEVYVSEVMSRNITSCSPDTTIREVITIMSRNHLSSLVIAEEGKPVGIITERDLVIIIEEMLNDNVRDELPIKLFMTSPTYTVKDESPLRAAIDLSLEKTIRHLPVVDKDDKLTGLLTQTNMVIGLLPPSS